MKNQILLCLILSVQPAFASDYMIFLGAGGEPNTPTTIFDDSIKSVAAYMTRNPSLKADVALNGGHSVTEQIRRDEIPATAEKSNFLEADYKRIIAKYKTMLESGEMKEGDQFMIYIDSHGASKQTQFKSHSIATAQGEATDLLHLKGSEVVDLDQLTVLRDLAKAKHVKMAIIDSSCHSGNSLALADENTCVISSTGPEHYGYGPFSVNMANAMTKGKTLEDAFLEARSKDTTPNLPMISTEAGVDVNDSLYEKIKPFLYHFDDKNDKLAPYLMEHMSAADKCISKQNFDSMLATIDKVEEMNTVTKKVLWWTTKQKEVDLSHLKELLIQYKNTLDTASQKMSELNIERLNNKEEIDVSARTGIWGTQYKVQLTWSDMMNSDYDRLMTNIRERIQNESDDRNKNSLMGTLDMYTKAKLKKDQLLQSNPDLSTLATKQDELKKATQSNYFVVSAIAQEERKLYQAMYKQAQKEGKDNSNNPCHNFKL